jgi:hypothetical protein
LQNWFVNQVTRAFLDSVVGLFARWAGGTLVTQANAIRGYRHWLAHGKRTASPPSVAPNSAYTTLTSFLQSCSPATSRRPKAVSAVDNGQKGMLSQSVHPY